MAKDKTRVALAQHVGKICAYLAVGKLDDAKLWARKLVDYLRQEGLI